MKKTIETLQEAEQSIRRAIVHLERGDLSNLLLYFEEGYTFENWHLPSVVTKYLHEAESTLMRALNDVLVDTRWSFDEARVESGRDLFLSYIHETYGKENIAGELHPHQRLITFKRDYEKGQVGMENVAQLRTERIITLKEELQKRKRQWEENQTFLRRLTKRHVLPRLEKRIIILNQEIDMLVNTKEEDIAHFANQRHLYRSLLEDSVALERVLRPYGIKIKKNTSPLICE